MISNARFLVAALASLFFFASAAFCTMETADLDRLVTESGGLEQYPQASILSLLDRSEIRIDSAGFEYRYSETLFKILDDRAKDAYGDRSIRFDADEDTVIIESAQTRLPDGTWIEPEKDAFTVASAPEVQWASAYSQLKQQNVSFPGLAEGAAVYFEFRVVPKAGSEPPKHPQAGGIVGFGGFEPSLKETFSIESAKNRPIQYEMQNSDRKPRIVTTDSTISYYWEFDNLEQISSEPNMVGLSHLVPRLCWTTFANWEELGIYIGRYFWEKVDSCDTAVKEYFGIQTAQFQGKPALMNAQFWIQTNIRTVPLSFGAVGYEPNTADEVWKNRYGDARDKSVLLAAISQAYGLQVIPVLVQESNAPFIKLPVLEQFSHLFLAVPIGDDTIWADATNRYYQPGEISYDETQGTACLLVDGEPMLTDIPSQVGEPREARTEIRANLNENGDLIGSVYCTPSADFAANARALFQDQKTQERDIYFQHAASRITNGTIVKETQNSDPFDLVEPFAVSLEFEAPEYAVIQDDIMLVEPPTNPFSFALSGFYPTLPVVKYPIELPIEAITVTESVIELPKGYEPTFLPPRLIVDNPYVNIELIARESERSLTWTQSINIKTDIVPLADYPVVRAAFEQLLLPKNRLAILEKVKTN